MNYFLNGVILKNLLKKDNSGSQDILEKIMWHLQESGWLNNVQTIFSSLLFSIFQRMFDHNHFPLHCTIQGIFSVHPDSSSLCPVYSQLLVYNS